ncbi:hypothetical protein A6V39_01855 [Candidatus Mycoplasma haematobovis]|uniref:Uncharacterized protein n=1 Tax=Candidatus Mycoplasma haematobovis TaxID=432608 RepID=A0A1A9QDZ7_9MOLU|nr:hypothetical protein [Candidatus Mycoplasma haematobovis]OAL10176.1 hypothetical protein A6V39_01855 [Candidatus Mycoplasma haematobovis]
MENINRVNQYCYLRLLVLPFSLPLFLIKYWRGKKDAQDYLFNRRIFTLEDRYGRFLTFLKRLHFIQNKTFIFLSQHKISKNQTIFLVNEDISWDTLILLRFLAKDNPYIIPFLNRDLLRGNSSLVLDLVDAIYEEQDLQLFFQSKRSLLISKDFLFSEAFEPLKNSKLSIIPIYFQKKRREFFYKAGEAIKSQELFYLTKKAMEERVSLFFEQLKKELWLWINKNKIAKRKSSVQFFKMGR